MLRLILSFYKHSYTFVLICLFNSWLDSRFICRLIIWIILMLFQWWTDQALWLWDIGSKWATFQFILFGFFLLNPHFLLSLLVPVLVSLIHLLHILTWCWLPWALMSIRPETAISQLHFFLKSLLYLHILLFFIS